MIKKCTSCDIRGDEIKINVNTLEDCKNWCIKDDRCKGIDFGKGRWRSGECFINIEQSRTYTSNSDFDGWVWSKNCGTIIILNY